MKFQSVIKDGKKKIIITYCPTGEDKTLDACDLILKGKYERKK